tara:strand:- start:568 stop:2259 length:1692 start_codon:yes stop_codon:yes gene_type:complete
MIGVMIPSGFSTSGEIFLEKNEFTLYGDGSLVTFSVTGEIVDYTHRPTLEIVQNDVVIQSVNLVPIKNSLFSVIGLDKNFSAGEYFVNLKYKNNILDTKSFTITRDNVVEKQTKIHENMSYIFESYVELTQDKFIINNNSDESLIISGNIISLQFGNPIFVLLHHPDSTIEKLGTVHQIKNGFFNYPIYGIDKYWKPGTYVVSVNYLDHSPLTAQFTIENDWVLSSLSKSHTFSDEPSGLFDLSFDKLDEYVILKIDGNVRTNDSQIKLVINSDNAIVYENNLLLLDGDFYDNVVLYDYENDVPWKNTQYEINVLLDQNQVITKTFTFDESLLLSSNNEVMGIELIFSDEIINFSNEFEIEIFEKTSEEITLSGNIPNYQLGDLIDVNVLTPSGEILKSNLRASVDGDYFLPIIITDSWISGNYVISLIFNDIVRDTLDFTVLNHKLDDKQMISNETPSDNIVESIEILEIQHYDVIINNNKIEKNILFTQPFDSNLQHVPITIVTPNDSTIYEYTYHSKTGDLQKWVNIDHTWISGDYFVYYVVDEIPNLLGTFHIRNLALD